MSEENTSIEIVEEHMGQQLLEAMLDELKALQDPWDKTPEERQDEALRRLESRIKHLVRESVNTIAAGEWPIIRAQLESVTVKDGVKAVLKAHKDGQITHDLVDAEGSNVLIVITDSEQYLGGMSEVQGDPDQPELAVA